MNQELYEQLCSALRELDVEKLIELSSALVEEVQTKGKGALACETRSYEKYMEQHSISVSAIAVEIGVAMGLGEIVLGALATAGLLQDLGMASIDQAILNKATPLTEEEYAIIKKHPYTSVEMIEAVPGVLPMVKTAILHHHENVNGTGYPEEQEGEEIPLLARILHVADAYDGIMSDKPYKKGMSRTDALTYLDGGKTLLFDEKVVNALFTSENFQLADAENLYSGGGEQQAGDTAGRKKILVVDDVYVSILHTTRALGDAYDVVHCLGGRNVPVMMKAENPDLILMDYEMPDVDGVTAVMKLRQAGYQTPVIFLTGKSDRETVVACGRVGAVDYILKPANPVYLQTRVDMALYRTRE